jgi:hypothetical protein
MCVGAAGGPNTSDETRLKFLLEDFGKYKLYNGIHYT